MAVGKGFAGLCLIATCAFADATSESKFVYVNPAGSYLWRTARSRTMTLPVPYPTGATVAELKVNGRTLASGISSSTVEFTLPAPRSRQGEDVYELELSFDKGPSATARLGLVNGCSDAPSASTSVLAPSGTAQWNKVWNVAVVPVPSGTTSLEAAVGGGEAAGIETGLDGGAGWAALKLKGGETAVLAADAPQGRLTATLQGAETGFSIMVR